MALKNKRLTNLDFKCTVTSKYWLNNLAISNDISEDISCTQLSFKQFDKKNLF